MKKKVTIFDVANFFLKIVDRDSGSTITPLNSKKYCIIHRVII